MEIYNPEPAIQAKIMRQLVSYQKLDGLFGRTVARESISNMKGTDWWNIYGSVSPELQKLAVTVLCLPISVSVCETNWSNCKHIQTDQRNRLTASRLEKLVYVYGSMRTLTKHEKIEIDDE